MGGLRLGRVRGTPIVLYPTALLLVGFFAYLSYIDLQRAVPAGTLALLSVGMGIGVLVSILLHELGHMVTARMFGIHTTEVSLYGLGGMARLASLPRTPWADTLISVSGPLVSLGVGAALHFGMGQLLPSMLFAPMATDTAVVFTLYKLGTWNLFIGALNLLPGPPLDGGGVVRGICWAATRSRERGIRASGFVGVTVAAACVVLLVTRQLGREWDFTLLFVAVIIGLGSLPLVRGTLPAATTTTAAARPSARRLGPAEQEVAETAARARELAVQLGADVVTATHLLLGVLAYRLSLTARILAERGITFDSLWGVAGGTATGSTPNPNPPFSVPVRQMVDAATRAGHGRDGLLLQLPEGSEAAAQLGSLGVRVQDAKADLAAAISARDASR